MVHDVEAASAADRSTRAINAGTGREPLRPVLIGDQMTEMLRDAIVTMHFKPGQRLVVRELEEWSGVSRATIRESIRQLAAEGLIEVIPQRGAIVATPTKKEAAEIYEIRAMLEGLIGQQFVERATQAQKDELFRAFDTLRALIESDSDTSARLQAKNDFYEVLFDGADNSTVRAVLGGFQARVSVLRATTMGHPGRAEESIVELKAIVDAVAAGSAADARNACAAHVLSARRLALELLESASKGGPDT